MHDCRKVKVAEEIVQDYHKKKTKTTSLGQNVS